MNFDSILEFTTTVFGLRFIPWHWTKSRIHCLQGYPGSCRVVNDRCPILSHNRWL